MCAFAGLSQLAAGLCAVPPPLLVIATTIPTTTMAPRIPAAP